MKLINEIRKKKEGIHRCATAVRSCTIGRKSADAHPSTLSVTLGSPCGRRIGLKCDADMGQVITTPKFEFWNLDTICQQHVSASAASVTPLHCQNNIKCNMVPFRTSQNYL